MSITSDIRELVPSTFGGYKGRSGFSGYVSGYKGAPSMQSSIKKELRTMKQRAAISFLLSGMITLGAFILLRYAPATQFLMLVSMFLLSVSWFLCGGTFVYYKCARVFLRNKENNK